MEINLKNENVNSEINLKNDLKNANENENANSEIIEILIEANIISMQLKDALEYSSKILNESLSKIKKFDLSQTTISDIQRMMYVTEHNASTYAEMHLRFENELYKNCDHNWCDDYVDDLHYECRRIIYCNKCELTKR